jgi:hypothetical protein
MRQYLRGKSIFDSKDGSPPDDDSDSSDGSIIYLAKTRSTNKADAALHFKDAPGIRTSNPITSSTARKSSKDVIGESIQIDAKPVNKPRSSQGQNSGELTRKAKDCQKMSSKANTSPLSVQPNGTDGIYLSDSSEEDDDGGCDYNEQSPSSKSNTRKHIPRAPIHLRIQPAPTAVGRSAEISTGRMAPQSPRSPTTATWWTGPAPIIVTLVGSACTDLPQLRNYVGEFLLRDYMSREDFLDLADLFWSCPHCWKLLDQPVLHPCGHMACLKCVREWVWHENSGPPCCVECATCLVPGCQAQFDDNDQVGVDAHKQEWWDQVQVSLVLEETMRLIWRIYGSRRSLPMAHM